MRALSHWSLIPALALAWLPGVAVAAGVAVGLSHHGRLLDAEEQPVNGALPVTFTLHTQPSAGTPEWSETWLVEFVNGYYAVVLGVPEQEGGTPLDPALFDRALYLGITIGDGPELVPRQQLAASAYALRARLADALAPGGHISGATILDSTVDASSLSVGGVELFDQSGAWVAPQDVVPFVPRDEAVLNTGDQSVSGSITASRFISTETLDAPFEVNSEALVINLNAHRLDGRTAEDFVAHEALEASGYLNLVHNGSFEQGDVGEAPEAWEVLGSGVALVEDGLYGDSALRIDDADAGAVTGIRQTLYGISEAKGAHGRVFTASVWARRIAGSATGTLCLSDGPSASQSSCVDLPTGAAWSRVAVTHALGESPLGLFVSLGATSQPEEMGSVEVDALSVTEGPLVRAWSPHVSELVASVGGLDDGAVTTAKLADGAVTVGKIASGAVGTAQLAVAAVVAEKIADGAVGTAQLANGAVTEDALGVASVTTTRLAPGAVDATRLASESVTEEKLAVGAVTAEAIAPLAVDTPALADGAVTAEKLAAGAVGIASLDDGSVTRSKIAIEAVDAERLADGAVTAGKLAALSVGSGALAEGSVGSSKLSADAVLADKLADGAVTTPKLFDGAVSEAKLADLAVTTSKLADLNVTREKLADGAVDSTKLAANAVTSGRIATGAITGEKLGDGAVTETKLAPGAVTTSRLGQESVTAEKLADGAVTAAKIGPLAVDAVALADGAVTEAKLRGGAVSAAKIAEGAVLEDKLAIGAVTSEKLGTGAVVTDKLAELAVTETKLGNAAVITDKLADGAVNSAKIENLAVSTDKLAGEAVTAAKLKDGAVTSNKLADGAVSGAKIADQTITGGKLVHQTVGEGQLAALAVTTAKLADGAVTNAKLFTGAVDTPKLADGAVTELKLATNAVTTEKLANLQVTGAKMAPSTITGDKLATGAIGENQLAGSAVTADKLASSTSSLARVTGGLASIVAGRFGLDGDVLVGSNTGSTGETRRVTIQSDGYAGLFVRGDASNVSGEPGGAWIKLGVDGENETSVGLLLSRIQSAGQDGQGGTYEGTATNSNLVGTVGNTVLQLGTNGVVRGVLSNDSMSWSVPVGAPNSENIYPDPHFIGRILGNSDWYLGEGVDLDNPAQAGQHTSAGGTTTPGMAAMQSWQIRGGRSQNAAIVSTQFVILPSRQYQVSVWAGAVNDGSIETNCTSRIKVRWYSNAAGTTLISESEVGSTNGTLSTSSAPRINGVVTAPAGAIRARLVFWRDGGSSNDMARFSRPEMRLLQ